MSADSPTAPPAAGESTQAVPSGPEAKTESSKAPVQTRKQGAKTKSVPKWQDVTRWVLLVAIVFLAATMAFLGTIYLFPQDHRLYDQQQPFVSVSNPRYVAVGDEGEVSVTVANKSGSTITNTIVVIAYEGALPVTTGLEQGNAFSFGPMLDREQQSKSLKLHLLADLVPTGQTAQGRALPFRVWVQANQSNWVDAGGFSISIAPVAYLRRTYQFVFAGWGTVSALGLWALKQMWDRYAEPKPDKAK